MFRYFILSTVILIGCVNHDQQKTEEETSVRAASTKVSDQPEISRSNNKTNSDTTVVNERSKYKNHIEFDSSSYDSINLTRPNILVIQLDSLEIENIKEIDGEDNFYTGADDLMYYEYLMDQKMDSLNIPVTYTNKDWLKITSVDTLITIRKDSTYTLHTYFIFDSAGFRKTDLFSLLDY